MVKTYAERKDQLITTDWEGVVNYVEQIKQWLVDRPNIFAHNKEVSAIVHHMLNEVEEVNDEIEIAFNGGSQRELEMESGDVAFLALGLVSTNGIDLDLESVRRRVNGLGGKSNFIDYFREVVGNIEQKSLKADLEHLLMLWTSYLLALPTYTPPGVITKRVVSKDEANYPAQAFPAVGVTSQGVITNGALADLGFSHPRRQLRAIRDHLVHDQGLIDRKDGLQSEDFEPHLYLITAHKLAVDLYGSQNIQGVTEFADLAHANLVSLLQTS